VDVVELPELGADVVDDELLLEELSDDEPGFVLE
jgi:hypothetical protein